MHIANMVKQGTLIDEYTGAHTPTVYVINRSFCYAHMQVHRKHVYY